MKKLLLIFLPMLFVAGCVKDVKDTSSTCDLNDPIEELAWLKEVKNSLINCTCEMSIIQATYNDQTVFYVAMTDPLCDGIQAVSLLDCEGKVVTNLTNNEYLGLKDSLTNIKILYRCKTSD